MEQLLSIATDGSISTIRRKRGTGLDLRDLGGEMEVRRVSEIVWIERHKGFTVVMINKDGSQIALMTKHLTAAGISYVDMCRALLKADGGGVSTTDGVLFFDEYEGAVAIEVLYLDAAKRLGIETSW